jgi:hypothetical protein
MAALRGDALGNHHLLEAESGRPATLLNTEHPDRGSLLFYS